MTVAPNISDDSQQPTPVTLDVETGLPVEDITARKITESNDAYDDESPSKKAAVIEERKGTFFGSIVTLGMTTMGIGILNLPKNFSDAGYVLAPIFVVLCAMGTVLSLVIMVRVAKRTGRYSYETLSDYYLGFWGTIFTNWSLLIQLFFVVVAFLTIPMNTVQSLLSNAGPAVCKNAVGSDDPYSKPQCTKENAGTVCTSAGEACFKRGMATLNACGIKDKLCFCAPSISWYGHEYFIGAIVAILIGLTGLTSTLAKISPISTLAFFSLSTAIILLLVIFVQTYTLNKAKVEPSTTLLEALTLLGNMVLAYQSQFNVLQCYRELKVPKNVDKLIYLTIFGVALPLYLFVGIIGLLVVPEDGEFNDNIFDSLGDNKVAQAAKWLVVVMAVCKTPLVFSPARDLLISELNRIPSLKFITLRSFLHRAVISSIMIIICYFFAWFLPLGTILSVAGALCGVPTAFIIPGLYYMCDSNMHGMLDATKEQLTGLAVYLPHWARYTPLAKTNYILGLICALVGFFGTIAALVGVFVTILS
eukprot:GEMP01003840.1.p1 GENE.GEMP01003840.1~~GEMP01003840.1.p1  ORF type:complete len:533 (+),score=56.53 GEMP01003840.1:1969-3567(+)